MHVAALIKAQRARVGVSSLLIIALWFPSCKASAVLVIYRATFTTTQPTAFQLLPRLRQQICSKKKVSGLQQSARCLQRDRHGSLIRIMDRCSQT